MTTTERNYENVKSALSALENAIYFLNRTEDNEIIISALRTCAKDLHIKQANSLMDSAQQK